MAEITKEQVLEFIKNNDLDWDESYPRSDWWKFRDERDAYKKQRDELINDMVEVKRKASLFDEIEGLVSKTKSAEDLGECVLQLLIENKEADHER
ncbi:hypothetical protein [Staphylococcus hominis]|uniref:hypothetical protein n=1 Tax=Staphylococcus hominis TaxID=1290 RepID=UPI00345B1B46